MRQGLSAAEVESAFDALLAWSRGGPKPPTGHRVNQGSASGGMGIGASLPAGAPGRAGRGPPAGAAGRGPAPGR